MSVRTVLTALGSLVFLYGPASASQVIHHYHGNDPARWSHETTMLRIPVSFAMSGEGSFSVSVSGNRETQPARLIVDGTGNTYVVGTVYVKATGVFPTTLTADSDVFVTKLDPAGNHLYTIYFGGDGLDAAHGVTTDAAGNIYIVGETGSGNFPTVNATQPTKSGGQDAFVCKLNSSGGFVFCTYLGGLSNDYAYAVAVDTIGSLYVTGSTGSTTFPVTPGAIRTTPPSSGLFPSSGFVTKLTADGSRVVYSTYLGGSKVTCLGGSHCVPAASHDAGRAIAVDSQGNAYVAGTTNSNDFPVTPGAFQATCHCTFDSTDAFISKLNPSGTALIFSTYLGGTASMELFPEEVVTDLKLDSLGQAYVAGSTGSVDFPTTPGSYRRSLDSSTANAGQSVPFVTKLNALGTALMYSTFLSSQGPGSVNAIQLTSDGSVHITGTIAGNDFPVTEGAFTRGGDFFSRLTPDGAALAYSSRFPDGFAGGDIALDPNGAVYLLGPGGYVSRSTLAGSGYLLPPLLGVANYCRSQVRGRVAPGELVSIYGPALGVDPPISMQIDANGIASTALAGTRVLFDGVPSPLAHVQRDQIDAVVPGGIYAHSPVTMQVLRNDAVVAQIELSVVSADPEVARRQVLSGVFTPPAPAAALNQDGTVNTAENPAQPGTIVAIVATGLGPTDPPIVDGEVSIHRLSQLRFPVTVTPAGAGALELFYAGQAPGLIAGAMQINFRLSSSVLLGPVVYLTLQIGDWKPVSFTIAGPQ